jgi:hypothetical protein
MKKSRAIKVRFASWVMAGLMLVGLTSAMPAGAGTLTVMGIPLSEPIKIGACPAPGSGQKIEHICTYFPGTPYSLGTPNRMPIYVMGVSASPLDGKIEELILATGGAAFQNQALSALTEKFGKPTKQYYDQYQNGYGAQWKSLTVDWISPDYSVHYETSLGNRQVGRITIKTKTWLQHEQANTKKEPKL